MGGREAEVKEEMEKEMVGSPSILRRGKTSREHSVHFPDSLMTAEQERGSSGVAEVDTVDLGRKGRSKEEGEREEQEELERVRSQMQQRERRDSLELVKEVPHFSISQMFAEYFYILSIISEFYEKDRLRTQKTIKLILFAELKHLRQ